MEPILEETHDIITTGHNACTLDKCNAIQTSNQETADNKLECMGNFCMQCGINMGDCNPRQLCGKTYCMQEDDL